MFIKTPGGKEYAIHFHHASDEHGHRSTICTIHEGPCVKKEWPCGTQSVTGIAYCSVKDQFDRAAGRKVALGRAVQNLTQDKSTRADLWTAYRNRPTQKPAQA